MDPRISASLIADALQAAALLIALGAAVGLVAGAWRWLRGPRETDPHLRRPHRMR